MPKYADASQVSTPGRALLPKEFGFRSTSGEKIRIFEEKKTLHLLSGLLFHMQATAAKGEQQNCSNSVQKLVWRLKLSPLENTCCARYIQPHLRFFSLYAAFSRWPCAYMRTIRLQGWCGVGTRYLYHTKILDGHVNLHLCTRWVESLSVNY